MKARGVDEALYYRQLQQLFNYMAGLAIGMAVVLTLLSRPIVLVIFGEQFEAAAPVLAVHAWAGCFVFLGVARSTWLVTEHWTRASIAITSVGAVANVLLNLVLIPRYRELGSAIATVVSYGLADYVTFLVYKPFRRIGWMMTRALFFRWSAR
jgi:PST family polysaccharide transporter